MGLPRAACPPASDSAQDASARVTAARPLTSDPRRGRGGLCGPRRPESRDAEPAHLLRVLRPHALAPLPGAARRALFKSLSAPRRRVSGREGEKALAQRRDASSVRRKRDRALSCLGADIALGFGASPFAVGVSFDWRARDGGRVGDVRLAYPGDSFVTTSPPSPEPGAPRALGVGLVAPGPAVTVSCSVRATNGKWLSLTGEGIRRKQSTNQKIFLPRTPPYWHLDLGFPGSRIDLTGFLPATWMMLNSLLSSLLGYHGAEDRIFS
ncbi:uncharacterized protein [Odocoileus virginianus]|uniref:Uncharacterized protein n=1 Tax=Odocoileus virginianus TaxID=9874 RepID=A0ABM4IXG6_ODOVR